MMSDPLSYALVHLDRNIHFTPATSLCLSFQHLIMSCQDDLTAVDLSSGVAVDVLERVSAGSGRDENLWSFIDINK